MRWVLACCFLVLWQGLSAQEQLPSHNRLRDLCFANDRRTLEKILDQHSRAAVDEWLVRPDLLCISARTGSVEITRLLLEYRVDPNVVSSIDGVTPLFIAAQAGWVDVVRLLLKSGADPNLAHGSFSRTPLYIAAKKGHISTVRLLLESEADPNLVRGRFGETPLFVAAKKSHVGVVRLLLSSRADPCVTNNSDGSTPLHGAAIYGHTVVAASLLEAGPVSPVDTQGNTPLHFAVNMEHPVLVLLLLQAGADPFVRNANGLMAASFLDLWALPHNPCQRAIAQLIRAQNRYQFVQYLLSWWTCRNIYGENRWVHEVIRRGRSRLALAQKCDLEGSRLDGCTPLHLAVLYRNRAAVAELVIRGVNLSPVNLNNETPLHLAMKDGYDPVVDILGPAVVSASENASSNSDAPDPVRHGDVKLFFKSRVYSLQDWTANALRGWLNIDEAKALFKQGILPVGLSMVLLGTRQSACPTQ